MSDSEDPVRSFTEQEEQDLSLRLEQLRKYITRQEVLAARYSEQLFCGWHRSLFRKIRDHAGRMRNMPGGADLVTFGGHVSCRRDELPTKISEHVEESNRLWHREGSSEPREVIWYALKIHADFIHIHPFDDGNGRIGRLILSYWCLKHHVRSPIFEVVKQEYLAALNHYYVTRRDLQPLFNLAMRMLRNQHDSAENST